LAKRRARPAQPVLVDFAADWCLTCQVNKQLEHRRSPPCDGKIDALSTSTALLALITRRFPDAITTELNRFNRAGVPLRPGFCPEDPRCRPPMVLALSADTRTSC
jgi:thiol:disulfide interchange protein